MDKSTRFVSNSVKLAALALAFCGAGNAMAATASATSTSTVVTPIAINKTADLSFGSFAAGASAGTVTVTPGGTRSFTGGAIGAGGTSTAAKFDVTGQSGMTYSITLGGSTTLSDGTNTMAFATISDVSASSITSGNVSSGALASGAQSIYVGGVLTVAANQVAGTYNGTVTATVDYN